MFGSIIRLLALLTAFSFMPSGYAATERPAYLLGSGDKIRVTVFDEPDLTGDHTVSDQGEISLPLIGRTEVAGRTINDVLAEIIARYGDKYLVDPRVSVDVLTYRPFFILGEVKNPGSYPYHAGMTVVNAIALAGGYTPRADRKYILVKRANSTVPAEQKSTEDDDVLPGDVISVLERIF